MMSEELSLIAANAVELPTYSINDSGKQLRELALNQSALIARVTNALSPTIGSTVAGGGAANALCWYNGTNWTVIGV